MVLYEKEYLLIAGEDVPFVVQIGGHRHQDLLRSRLPERLVLGPEAREEALLADSAEVRHKDLVDLVHLEADLLHVLTLHLEVHKSRSEYLLLIIHIHPHVDRVRVILVVWEAEPIVQQEELVTPLAITVESLFARSYRLPSFIHVDEVPVLLVALLGVPPVELLVCFFTVVRLVLLLV